LMRDPGLDQAIAVAGGVGALAKKIGISQPSVSNWSRVPVERVLAVEAVTGVSRAVLRPDLFADHPGTGGDVDEVDAARAQEYALLAALLARAPDQALLERLAGLRGDASPLGLAHVGLALAQLPRRSSASTSISSSGSGAGSSCPMARIILPGSCMSGRWRDCANTSRGSASSAPRASRSRKITPPSCVRSWLDWRADGSRRRRARSANCSSSIWRPGSGASSPIWSGPKRPISTAE
jgi:DNA-binding transcriptional regulator YdaS (Cro superfamily)